MSRAPTTTAAPATTAAPTTTPTTPTLDPCAAFTSVPVPPGAADVTTASGDLDGDALADTLTVYRVGGQWMIHANLGSGFGIETSFEPFNPGGAPKAEAVVSVGDPAELALINTGFGLPGPVFGVWAVLGCQLTETTLDGAEFYVWLGTGASHSEAFKCTADGITFIEAYQPGSDPNAWEVRETPYLWVPGLGDFQTQPASTYATDKASALAAAGDIDC